MLTLVCCRHNYQSGADWYKSLERKDQEVSALKDAKHGEAMRLGAAETRAAALENEVSVAHARADFFHFTRHSRPGPCSICGPEEIRTRKFSSPIGW